MAEAPIILFGACDRHNLGDLLFPHIAQALLAPRPVIVAGLAERDLTPCGGHRVAALARLAGQWEQDWGDGPAHLIHVGGELLSCSLYEAAVMTLPPDAAQAAIARYDRDETGRQAWAEGLLGLRQHVAYLVPKTLFRRPGRFLHCALGGVALSRLPATMRAEALDRLRESDALTVRDHLTQAALAEVDIPAELMPDAAVLTAALFSPRIADRAEIGAPARVCERFPQGYIAVQFAAELGDDATLRVLAEQFDRVVADTGLGLVLFRAGAAPWHDDLSVYRQLIGHMRHRASWLFESFDIWDLCALLSQARAYVGSSLHGRIVAACFGVPGINLLPPETPPELSKQAAYLATWHPDEVSGCVEPEALALRVDQALSQPLASLAAGQQTRIDRFRRQAVDFFPPLLAVGTAVPGCP